MKTLLLEGTGTAQQPIINRSYELIQEAYTEVIDAILKGLLGDPDEPYILYGCEQFNVEGNIGIRAGAIYHSGIVYLVDEVDEPNEISLGAGQVVIFDITTTYDAVDPITFTDGSTHNVHEIKKAVPSAGTSGAGNFDYDDCQILRHHLSMFSAEPSAFKVYDGTGAAWEATSSRFFGLGTFITANKIGDVVRLTYNLIIEFNNGGGNDLSLDASYLGFDLPTWAQPLYDGVIRRPSTCQNNQASSLNMIETCESIIYTGNATSNAPDMYFVFPTLVFNGGTAVKTTRKSNGFFNFKYPSDSTGTRLTSGSENFTLTIQGEVTYQSANYDLPPH